MTRLLDDRTKANLDVALEEACRGFAKAFSCRHTDDRDGQG